MILSSVIIILREALEAALLVSLLLALGNRLKLAKHWIAIAFATGCIGALLFARFLVPISSALDGTGQEVANAVLHGIIVVMLVAVVYLWFTGGSNQWLVSAMAVAVVAAIVREGSEIWIYYSGFVAVPELFLSTFLGGSIGLSIGISVGALLYYAVTLLPPAVNRWASLVLLALVAAGMTSQAVNELLQADYIPVTAAVWNSSAIVNEGSVAGQLLYALIGYEATPSLIQLLAYLLIFVCFTILGWRYRQQVPR